MAKAKTGPSPWRNAIVRYAEEDPASLLAHPLNFRTHPAAQTAALKGSLGELGWIAPVIVNETTQHVVDGHARIGEAIARGEATVPVAYVKLTEDQERLALATFDPIGALAGRDDAQLAALLDGLTVSDAGLADLLRDLAPAAAKLLHEDDADLTPPTEPITKPGDLWLLGEHRLLCGDSTNAADVEWLMAGRKADLCLTDPPYNVTEHQDGTASVDFGDWDRGFDPVQWWRVCVPILSPQHTAYVFGHHRTLAPLWIEWESDADYTGFLCWEKQSVRPTPYGAGWTWAIELIGFRQMKGHVFDCPPGGLRNYLDGDSPRGADREHPTQKPTGILRTLIEVSCRPRELVVDFFAGAGSTLVAAEQTGRTAYLIEIDSGYCDVIVRRWEHLTGREAVRERATVTS